MGENGAGKSTLMKIIAGSPFPGSWRVFDSRVDRFMFNGPLDAFETMASQ